MGGAGRGSLSSCSPDTFPTFPHASCCDSGNYSNCSPGPPAGTAPGLAEICAANRSRAGWTASGAGLPGPGSQLVGSAVTALR